MQGILLLLALALAARATPNTVSPAYAAVESGGWQLSSGKAPSRVEFAALVAACQDEAKSLPQTAPIEGCLVDYGLHRAVR
jgi:hypothetical protein